MSEVINPANAGNPVANAPQAANPEATQVPAAEPETANVNLRLLKEAKEWKARAMAAEKDKEEAEKAKLAEQGKYKDLFEKAQADLNSFRSKHVETQKKAAIERLAAQAGCINVDALHKLGNPSLIEYDAEGDRVQGAEMFLEDAKKAHPYLFQATKPPTINAASPGITTPVSYESEIRKAKTQSEFDAIRRKYGRE